MASPRIFTKLKSQGNLTVNMPTTCSQTIFKQTTISNITIYFKVYYVFRKYLAMTERELKDQMYYATELQVYAEPKPEGKKSTPETGNSNLLLKLKERVFKTHSMF